MKHTQVSTEFNIRGEDFDPDYVTEALGLSPSTKWRQGDIRIQDISEEGCALSGLTYSFSLWSITTGYQDSYDISDQLNPIIDLIKEKKNILLQLAEILELNYTIGIVIYIYNKRTPGVNISPDIMRFASDIGADIDIDLYV